MFYELILKIVLMRTHDGKYQNLQKFNRQNDLLSPIYKNVDRYYYFPKLFKLLFHGYFTKNT